MNQRPYSTYHGRKTLGRRILTAIVIILVIALALAIVGLFVLPNYVVYTPDGPQLVLPFKRGETDYVGQSAAPGPAAPPEVVIDVPGASATSAPSPQPAKVELSGFARRELVLGLAPVTREQLLAGEVALPARQGAFVNMTGADLAADADAIRAANAALPYAAAYVTFDPEDDLTALAALGFDELVLAETVPADNGAALAASYRQLRAGLDAAGWQGRLSLVLDQSLGGSGYASDLMAAIGGSFDRLFFKNSLQAGVKTALISGGFDAATTNIVTVYGAVPSVSWSWAVLPR